MVRKERSISMRYRIGIDLGGTNIAVGIVNGEGQIIHRTSVPTRAQRAGEEILEDIAQLVHTLVEGAGLDLSEIEQIGIGVPGTANKRTGILEYANNLNFTGISVTHWLEQRLKRPVKFENDANAAALGESLMNGEKVDSFLMLTLGTGVGGGVILGGKLLEGCNFAAAELGHMVIEKGGRPCTCGRKGCLEAYASATALITLANEILEQEEKPDSSLYQQWMEQEKTVNGRMIFDCARTGDAIAGRIIKEYVDYLAVGVTNLVNIFQPDIVCIGGGISAAADMFLDSLTEQVLKESYAGNATIQPKIIPAKLGNDAGIIGAAFL